MFLQPMRRGGGGDARIGSRYMTVLDGTCFRPSHARLEIFHPYQNPKKKFFVAGEPAKTSTVKYRQVPRLGGGHSGHSGHTSEPASATPHCLCNKEGDNFQAELPNFWVSAASVGRHAPGRKLCPDAFGILSRRSSP